MQFLLNGNFFITIPIDKNQRIEKLQEKENFRKIEGFRKQPIQYSVKTNGGGLLK